MKTLIVDNFNLKHTLNSGQIFRFAEQGEGYLINSMSEFFFVEQSANKLFFDGVKRKFVSDLFRLQDDYRQILKSINKDEIMNSAISKYSGLRVMEQNPWECLVSFICSSCSNIPRISKNIQIISEQFGEEIEYEGMKSFTFPNFGEINDKKKLEKARLGYRQKYLLEANEIVKFDNLLKLRKQNHNQCREYLTTMPGVGIKVADCVSLFSLRQDNAFPVDVWIKKAISKWYLDENSKLKDVNNFVNTYFDNYAGHAQQFIYHYVRFS